MKLTAQEKEIILGLFNASTYKGADIDTLYKFKQAVLEAESDEDLQP